MTHYYSPEIKVLSDDRGRRWEVGERQQRDVLIVRRYRGTTCFTANVLLGEPVTVWSLDQNRARVARVMRPVLWKTLHVNEEVRL